MDPRIRIRTKMSRIRNTGCLYLIKYRRYLLTKLIFCQAVWTLGWRVTSATPSSRSAPRASGPAASSPSASRRGASSRTARTSSRRTRTCPTTPLRSRCPAPPCSTTVMPTSYWWTTGRWESTGRSWRCAASWSDSSPCRSWMRASRGSIPTGPTAPRRWCAWSSRGGPTPSDRS